MPSRGVRVLSRGWLRLCQSARRVVEIIKDLEPEFLSGVDFLVLVNSRIKNGDGTIGSLNAIVVPCFDIEQVQVIIVSACKSDRPLKRAGSHVEMRIHVNKLDRVWIGAGRRNRQ